MMTMLTRLSISSSKKSTLVYRRESRRLPSSSIRTMILSAMKKPVHQLVITTAMIRVSLKDIGNML